MRAFKCRSLQCHAAVMLESDAYQLRPFRRVGSYPPGVIWLSKHPLFSREYSLLRMTSANDLRRTRGEVLCVVGRECLAIRGSHLRKLFG